MEKLSRIRALPVQRRFFDCGLRRISADAPLTAGLSVEAYQRAKANEQALYEVAISSEYPVPRWFGIETLRHDRSAIDMSYLKRGAAVLVDHGGDQVGVVEAARLGDDKVLRGVVRFSRSARGQEIERDVVDGIRRFISVGYQWLEARIVGEDDKHGEQWEVTRWKPMEVSFVAVPADVTVGVGRAADSARNIPFKFTAAADAQPEIAMNEEMDRPSRSARRALAQQNAEAADIIGMCTREGKPELAERFLSEGKSADEVGRFLLADRGGPTPEQLRAPISYALESSGYTPVVRGGETMPRGYSLANALRALADGENSVELEFSRDLAREHRYTQRANGVLVPLGYVFGMQQRAVIDSATTNAAK